MPTIEHAGHDIEVIPYVEEAVARLGIFRPEAIPYLSKGVAEFFNSGSISYEMRRAGAELSDSEKAANGLAKRTRMARKYWEALTDEGRAEPIKTPEVVFRRITSNLYREGKRRQMDASYKKSRTAGLSSFWDEVQLQTVDHQCCEQARQYGGKMIPTPDRQKLPLLGCDQEVCRCQYDNVSAHRIRRKERAAARPSEQPARRESFWKRWFG